MDEVLWDRMQSAKMRMIVKGRYKHALGVNDRWYAWRERKLREQRKKS
jgi:hypothetical protein